MEADCLALSCGGARSPFARGAHDQQYAVFLHCARCDTTACGQALASVISVLGGKFMFRALLTQSTTVLTLVALFSSAFVPNLHAEPINITSGLFVISDDDPNFFRFFGPDGFVLRGGFVPVPVSAKTT